MPKRRPGAALEYLSRPEDGPPKPTAPSQETGREKWKKEFLYEAKQYLNKRLVGQGHIVNELVKLIDNIVDKPVTSIPGVVKRLITFAGPSGVGKTTSCGYVAKLVTYYSALDSYYTKGGTGPKPLLDNIHGKEVVANIGHSSISGDIYGGNIGYVGFNPNKSLVNEGLVKANIITIGGRKVLFLVLDEFPAAEEREAGDQGGRSHQKELFNKMQLLFDQGKWGNVVNLGDHVDEVYIFMTTNVGHTAVQDARDNDPNLTNNDEKVIYTKELRKVIRANGSTPMLSRLNDILCFNAISPEESQKVAELAIENTLDALSYEYNTVITLSSPLRDTKLISEYIARGYSKEVGVRSVQQKLVAILSSLKKDFIDSIQNENKKIIGNIRSQGRDVTPNDLNEISLNVKVVNKLKNEDANLEEYKRDLENSELSFDQFYHKYSLQVEPKIISPRSREQKSPPQQRRGGPKLRHNK